MLKYGWIQLDFFVCFHLTVSLSLLPLKKYCVDRNVSSLVVDCLYGWLGFNRCLETRSWKVCFPSYGVSLRLIYLLNPLLWACEIHENEKLLFKCIYLLKVKVFNSWINPKPYADYFERLKVMLSCVQQIYYLALLILYYSNFLAENSPMKIQFLWPQ